MENTKKTNEEVEKLLEDKRITPEEYKKAIEIEDPREKEKALRELADRTYPKFRKAVNYISSFWGGNWAKNTTFEELKKSETSLEESINQLNIQNSIIGTVLFMSVNENEDMRNAFSGELTGEKTPNEPKKGFRELRKETLNEDDFFKNWKNKKSRTNFNGHGITPAEQEAIRNNFIDDAKRYYKKQHEGKGFLHNLILIMIEGLIDDKKNELT